MSHQPTKYSQFGKPLAMACAAVLLVLGGSAFASNPTPTPIPTPIPTPRPKPRVHVDARHDSAQTAFDSTYDLRSPGSPANVIQQTATDRIIDRMRDIQGHGATAGAEGKEVKETKEVVPQGPIWSVFGEYSYLNSEDHRSISMDSITHTATGGFDVTFNKTLAGLIYSWSHSGGSSDVLRTHTTSDSNFLSAYVAQSLTDWLSVGVTGGWGRTEVDVLVNSPFFPDFFVDSRTNTYTASPFVSLAYANGNFYGSLTTTFSYMHTLSNGSDALSFTLVGGYRFNDWFTAEVTGRFTQSLHNTQRGFPMDDDWFSVGPKFKEYITPRLYLYEAYQANLNESFTQHMVTGGVSWSF